MLQKNKNKNINKGYKTDFFFEIWHVIYYIY